MKCLKRFVLGVSSLAVLLLAGCSGREDGPERSPVAGQITLDSQPVESGEIRFVALDGSSSDAAPIKQGRYSGEVIPREKRVEIEATRKDPSKLVPSGIEPGKMEPLIESYIPARYNMKSELTATIPEAGNSELNFDLKSK